MPMLLQVDSSPMGQDAITRRLAREYRDRWLGANPDGDVLLRDLTTIQIPAVTAAWVAANYTPCNARTDEQRNLLKLHSELIEDLLLADEIVLGAPMHNFGPPASLKLWVDHIVTPATKSGRILRDKRATFIVAAGGTYRLATKAAGRDHLSPWLRTVFGALGLEDMWFIMTEGTRDIYEGSVDRETFLAPHLSAIDRVISDQKRQWARLSCSGSPVRQRARS